jgi:hypothetical protein
MVIGGSAAPASLIGGFKRPPWHEVTHAWGMDRNESRSARLSAPLKTTRRTLER